MAKKVTKKGATFQKPTKAELAEIHRLANKDLSDSKQNIIQFMKGHYQKKLNVVSLIEQHNKLQEAIEAGVVIKDDLGLARTERDLKNHALAMYIQIKFAKSELKKEMTEFEDKWKLGEADLDKYWEKWFVGDSEIEL